MTCCNSDDAIFTRSHTVGEELFFEISTEEGDNLTLIPFAAMLDSPDGETRHILGYLNGYSDGTLSGDTETVRLAKDAAWSAANMTGGTWRVRIIRGTADVDLTIIYDGPLNVIMPDYGAIDL